MEMAATLSVTPMTIVSVFSECPYGFYGDGCHPVCDSYDYCVYVFSVLMVSMETAATLSVTPMTIVSVFSECPYGFYGDGCHPVCDSYDYCVYVFRVSLWFLWRWLPPCL